MWLVDTETLQLRPVAYVGRIKYAILSHTWDGNREISYQDIQDVEKARAKPGFAKVAGTCDIARSKKIKYAWIDTCCIDKTSSAELSEAINSMFQWYKQAHVCYVYLSYFEPLPNSLNEKARLEMVDSRLRKCRWFTRGWTLQELVAPKKLEFFDRGWNFIGSKEDLERTLFEVTGIDGAILRDSSGLESIPIGRRMSWAVGRETTRIEDRAYSLLGIFNINMPLLYGEGTRAFFRLQQHIASQSNDLSLIAWRYKTGTDNDDFPMFSGVFADTPDAFWSCTTLRRHGDYLATAREFSITNMGMRISGGTLLENSSDNNTSSSSEMEFLLGLDCIVMTEEDDNGDDGLARWVAIRLKKVGDTFVRYMPALIATAKSRMEWTTTPLKHLGSVVGGEPASGSSSNGSKSSVYIQTMMRSDEIRRVSSLMNTGVVIVYDEYTANRITEQSGFPKDPQRSSSQVYTFPSRGEDNFHCAHVLKTKTEIFVVVCKLQWTGTNCELRIGVFNGQDILPAAFLPGGGALSKEDMLKEIKDLLLVRYSDLSGCLEQGMMPMVLPGCVGQRDGRLSVKPLRRLELNPLGSVFTWKEGYYHVAVNFSF